MHTAIYQGHIRHRRFLPREHAFRYRVFLVYLDLAELPKVFTRRWLWSARRPNLAWFRRADHLGDPARPLDESVRDLVQDRTGRRPAGPIRLLTHLRYFGLGFNPVSFYYCFDEADAHLVTIVAEVNNTPWGEQYCYVLDDRLDEGAGNHKRYRFAKSFHVSPFMPLDHDYDWRFSTPARTLAVHMENRDTGKKVFDATLQLVRRELGTASLARVLLTYPFMTAKVLAAIYYQALRLWLKRIPFFAHPDKLAKNEVAKPS